MKHFPKKIAVIGIGLIGGSICLGLKKHLKDDVCFIGMCENNKRSKKAKKAGIIDDILANNNIPSDIDMIILSTPISQIKKYIKLFSKLKNKNVLVIDVGSTKETICNLSEKFLPKSINFLGTHPMAGGEKSGFELANPTLFMNKPWILCPNSKTTKKNLQLVKNLVNILGAEEITLSPKKHDEIVAFASHYILISSSILFRTLLNWSDWREVSQVASTGLRDTTRLASFNPNIKTSIVLSNKKSIEKALKYLHKEISLFLDILKRGDETKLLNYFKDTKINRDLWLKEHF